jgi:hypothetical protein
LTSLGADEREYPALRPFDRREALTLHEAALIAGREEEHDPKLVFAPASLPT